jgi:gluconolactonase
VDGRTAAATVVTGDINGPNGLCFSPDEGKLYIVESRARPRLISVFDVVEDGTSLANRRVFINSGEGTPDGFRCDVEGNLWCGWGMTPGLNGVAVFAPDATMIGHIALPKSVLWRSQAKPPVHGGQPIALLGLCEHPGSPGRLSGL